jgi:hypothetical protein
MEEDISQIKSMLNQYLYRKAAPKIPQVMGSAVLSSTNTYQDLNPNYYYSFTFALNGSVTKDVNVYLIIPAQQAIQAVAIPINNTIGGYKVNGVAVNQVKVDTTNLGTAKVYLTWLGYDSPDAAPGIKLL